MPALLLLIAMPSLASGQTKSLKLYYLHTGEKAEIVFKRNGRFDPAGLKKINWFLRDWRRNEPTKMDPNLLDLVWEVYRKTGSNKHIHIISGYRAPASNELLRKRGRGVAKNSQHTRGKAMDFFIPGVKLSKLREIGLKMEVGGVGYYPKSGSPFVHMDTGNVRHWPRMSRSQLARVFPNGKTMHVPSDGKPLARYKQAVADYKRRTAKGKLVPQSKPTAKELNFFQRLARATREDEADDKPVAAPAPRPVATKKPPVTPPAAVTAPQPVPEPVAPAEPEQPQFAALPRSVPVPVVAPRQSAITAGTPAQQETPQAEEPLIEETAEPAPTIEETPINESEETIALASLSAPVPQKRPEPNPVIAEVANTSQPAEETTTELAMLQPVETAASNPAPEPLSPAEIEELRELVRPQVSQSPAVAAISDRPVPAAPVPAASVPAVPDDDVVEPITPVLTQPKPAATPALSAGEPEAPQAGIELAALPIEPGVESTGLIAVPAPSPVAADLAQAALRPNSQEEEASSGIQLAGIPVPAPAPRQQLQERTREESLDNQAPIATAALEIEPVRQTAASPELQQRPVSLDRLSAPRENTSVIGKWALSAGTTISELADVQAPAYGRNLIRQIPNSVILQQFNLQAFGPGQNRFNGKAVRAMKFARLQ